MMRVLIIDDHEQVRRGVREAICRTLGTKECGEAGSAAEGVRMIQEQPWDVVLLDLSLPDRSGLETLRELRRLRPDVPVLVMSMHPESHYGEGARAAGAAAYLTKGSDPEEIAAAVRGVLGVTAPVEGGDAIAALQASTGLARFLHDDLVQSLAAAKINLQLARDAGDLAEVQRQITESMAAIDSAIASVRRLSERLGKEERAS
jgi:DNA-binding NarL/FixJ family response regulator